MTKSKEVVVAVSGYFNPIHQGHVFLLKEAKKLGDKLIVILNNDNQVKLKGSVPFMCAEERAAIVRAMEGVDSVFLSIDSDRTVRESLRAIKPHVFANGGDRTEDEIPEVPVCNELGIEMVFNVGGKKVQSSSWLLNQVKKYVK